MIIRHLLGNCSPTVKALFLAQIHLEQVKWSTARIIFRADFCNASVTINLAPGPLTKSEELEHQGEADYFLSLQQMSIGWWLTTNWLSPSSICMLLATEATWHWVIHWRGVSKTSADGQLIDIISSSGDLAQLLIVRKLNSSQRKTEQSIGWCLLVSLWL